ncbi:zinc-binding dehydrogenase, partial [Escherichia coli]
IKPDEQFLFHAAAGGVGLIACQWAKALGAKLIGTTGSAQKAQRALDAGAWQVINYREESIVERLKEITGGKKVRVVYDSVGKDTWESSLD